MGRAIGVIGRAFGAIGRDVGRRLRGTRCARSENATWGWSCAE
jgi:hypothetical protein